MSSFLWSGTGKEDTLANNYMWLGAATLTAPARRAFYELPWDTTPLTELLNKGAISGPLEEFADRAAQKEELARMEEKLSRWGNEGIRMVPLPDAAYPESLKSIFQPPPVLFMRGADCNEALRRVGIVGSRSGDISGCEIARGMARVISDRGGCVVSGLALGIDGAAHEGSLEGSGPCPTIAVLGCGIDLVYPSSHERLARRIVDRGGIIMSQFEPGTQPFPSNFLDRNRVIAGLSHGVVVIQAAERSGALSTARHALEEGRDLMVVPGSITDKRYRGSNSLIKQGAYLVTSVEDVVEIVGGLAEQGLREGNIPGSSEERLIVEALCSGELHYDEVSSLLDDPTRSAEVILDLELSGYIERLPGNFLSLRPR